MKRQIVNLVHFIRDSEPRVLMDLVRPVREQIALHRRYNLKGTFLLQYDALIDPVFQQLLCQLSKEQFEIGLWIEVVQQQAEAAGLVWKGAYSWDSRSNFSQLCGYQPNVREQIIDLSFQKFYDVFGYFPKSVGSWVLDAHSLQYMSEKYDVAAFCNCKDQYGTDGYTLWGGYYGQGYYPSKRNALCPAQTAAQQIDTPVFRMLGSDPIYQYDCGMDFQGGSVRFQPVISLEPVYETGGGDKAWVDWYLRNNFSGDCLSFGYAQAGQENSFGWEAMQKGLSYQFSRFAALQQEGKLTVETLAETGRWYQTTYPSTPASTIVTLEDWKQEGHASIWYSSNRYRINLYREDQALRIRDLHLFCEDYAERYLADTCPDEHAIYDTLPIADGNVLSGNGILGGLFFQTAAGERLSCTDISYSETGCDSAQVKVSGTPCGEVTITLRPDSVQICAEQEFCLQNSVNNKSAFCPEINVRSAREVQYCYRGYCYTVKIKEGNAADSFCWRSENGQLHIALA